MGLIPVFAYLIGNCLSTYFNDDVLPSPFVTSMGIVCNSAAKLPQLLFFNLVIKNTVDNSLQVLIDNNSSPLFFPVNVYCIIRRWALFLDDIYRLDSSKLRGSETKKDANNH